MSTNTSKVIAAIVVAVSAAGVGLVSKFEGTVYKAYADPAHGWAVPTICTGHTAGVKRGDTATKAQCDTWLAQDLNDAATVVRKLSKVNLTQGELDAYTSFVFNVGQGNFASSTLLRKLNAGYRKEACDQLLRWDYAAGIKLAGLTKRRAAERTLCLSQLK